MATGGGLIHNRDRIDLRVPATRCRLMRDEISPRDLPKHRPDGGNMAQIIESSFICDGRFRLFTILPMGRKIGRIIEIEEVDTGKRVHGTARKLERLVLSLRRSNADEDGVTA